MLDPNVAPTIVTRPTRDGGRDVLGTYGVGPSEDRINFEFALEAKCWDPGSRDGTRAANCLGVRDVSRLVARLRARQLGFVVTTSAVAEQAYKEIRADEHPVVILSGGDIARLLIEHGRSDWYQTRSWLLERFPKPRPSSSR
jgi:hypothetical protein